MIEETEVVIGPCYNTTRGIRVEITGTVTLTEGIIIIGHDVGECIRDVSACDDLLGLPRFVCQL